MKFRVRVISESKKPGVRQEENGDFVVKVKSRAKKGEANNELTDLLTEHLGVKRSQITITSGYKSTKKTIEIRQHT